MLDFKVLARGTYKAIFFERTKWGTSSWTGSALSIHLVSVLRAENTGIRGLVQV